MAKNPNAPEETPEITTTVETAVAAPAVVAPLSEFDQLVETKIKAGLPRDIALEVAKNQLAHNANLEARAVAEAAAKDKSDKKTKTAKD